ncbi:MAG TPA: YdcF family protein [Candidatus Binatia bacterium]
MRSLLRLLVLLLLVAALVPWLPRLLAATDPLPPRADAIFVFAGDVPDRPRCAAELYARGLAPRVVFGGGRTLPELIAVERPMTDAVVNATIAMQNGLPIEAAVVLPEGTSTWEDAAVLRRWVEQSGAKSIVAVTSPLHSRRARTTLRLTAGEAGFDVRVHACGEPLPPESLWWLEERPLIQVTNETLKLALYTVRYFVPAWLGFGPVPGSEAPARHTP